jgi:hypothetical protein
MNDDDDLASELDQSSLGQQIENLVQVSKQLAFITWQLCPIGR